MTSPIVNPTVEEEFDVIGFLAEFTDEYEADMAERGCVQEGTRDSLIEALSQSLLDRISLTTLLSDPYARRVLEVIPLRFALSESGTWELEKPINAGSGITAEMKRDDSDDGELKSVSPVKFMFDDTLSPREEGYAYVIYVASQNKFDLRGTQRDYLTPRGYEDRSTGKVVLPASASVILYPHEITQITLAEVGEQN